MLTMTSSEGGGQNRSGSEQSAHPILFQGSLSIPFVCVGGIRDKKQIIDLIIAREGFEQILAVDYKTRRMGLRSASGASKADHMSLQDISYSAPSVDAISWPDEMGTKRRPISMMVRVRSAPKAVPVPPVESEPKAREIRQKSDWLLNFDIGYELMIQVKRGFSLDFRSLASFGASFPSSPKPVLKPLTLPNRTSPVRTSASARQKARTTRRG